MKAVDYLTLKEDFGRYYDTAVNNYETIMVTRDEGESIVMMSESEYNNLMENLFIRSNPDYYKKILKSIEELKTGKTVKAILTDE